MIQDIISGLQQEKLQYDLEIIQLKSKLESAKLYLIESVFGKTIVDEIQSMPRTMEEARNWRIIDKEDLINKYYYKAIEMLGTAKE